MGRKDAPANDPNVKALGYDVCAMSPAELEQAGVTTGRGFVSATGQRWLMHSEYLVRCPDHDVTDRAYARAKAHLHVASTGTLQGLHLLRPFPCTGTFRVELDTGRGPVLVVCDACGQEMGVPWEREADGGLEPPEPQTPGNW